MVLLYLLAFLCHILPMSCVFSAERHLLCSSESISIWYSYNGPFYYLSLAGSPCTLGFTEYNVTYTVIPMFTICQLGFHARVYYKGQLWLDHEQPNVVCEDLKICNIIKGETLHETVPIYVRKFYGPEGEYQIHANFTSVDDLEKTQILHVIFDVQVKKGDVINTIFHLGHK